MKVKEIEELFGVSPSTYFGWKKNGNKKANLAKLLETIDVKSAGKILKQNQKEQKPSMLLSTVNCSIGNASLHFTATKLKKTLTKNGEYTPLEKYALKVIKHEGLKEEIMNFTKYYKIPDDKFEKAISSI